MKKLILSLAVVAFAFAGTSCKKDYVCECDLGLFGTTSVTSEGLSKSEAEDAEAACTNGGLCTWKEA